MAIQFLKRKTIWSAGELWIFKWGVFTAGILVGCYFNTSLEPYKNLLWFVSASCCLLAAGFWYAKIKR